MTRKRVVHTNIKFQFLDKGKGKLERKLCSVTLLYNILSVFISSHHQNYLENCVPKADALWNQYHLAALVFPVVSL